jgi:Carboxypeptidase regulatory-like domain
MFRNVSTILVFLFALSAVAFGQSAQIGGQVQDASGAIVAKALVRVIDQQTSAERKTETNAAGQYAVPGLNPGIYKIIVQAPGFSTAVSNAISLNVAQSAVFDVQLQVGTTSSEVVVGADNVSINTTDGSVSTVIDRQLVDKLPLNGRSFQSLLYLSPGVSLNWNPSNTALSQGQFVVNGQRGDANYWMVDGVSANVGMSAISPGAGISGAIGATSALGGTSAMVSVDALQEFRIQTSSYNPEYGRLPGGQISLQTRSGSNQFHATLFDYLRNGDLDATDWFADHNNLQKPLEIQNDFGGVTGGPIVKDRTFFFFSYEGLRLKEPVTLLATVPSLQTRQMAIPEVKPYLDMYPVPKPGVADVLPGVSPYNTTFSNPGSSNTFSLRLDDNLLKNVTVFARYSHAPSTFGQRSGDGNAANTIFSAKSVTKTATAGLTWIISPQVVNDARLNYSVAGGKTYLTSDDFGGGTPFPDANFFADGLTAQNALFTFTPLFGTHMSEYQGLFGQDYQHQYNLVDVVTAQKGAHNLKFGFDYRRLLPAQAGAVESLLTFFSDAASMAAGNTAFTVIITNPLQRFELNNMSAFGQDSWRVTPRFTLTYGLRWDVDYVAKTLSGPGFAAPLAGYSTTDLSGLTIAPSGTAIYHTRYGNVAPRVGGAYRISTDPALGAVLRGGFGVFYGMASTELFNYNFYEGIYPTGASAFYPSIPFPTPVALRPLPPVVPPDTNNGETLFGVDPNLNVPYALEWNLAIEQQLGAAQTLTLSYVGASDQRLLLTESVTNPNPNYASAVLVGNEGSSNFQSLQLQYKRSLSKGLLALVSYAWSHSIDTGSYGDYTNGGFADLNANRGDSDFDVRHTLSSALSYQVPVWSSNRFIRVITSDWATDNEVQIRTGAPIDVQDANYTAVTAVNSSVVVRPDIVPGQPRYLTGPQFPGGKALNPAAFVDPPTDPVTGLPTRQGNLSRNSSRALGSAQWDFSARRDFPISENIRLQFRAEMFNLLNHPNFGPFNNQFMAGNPVFGQSTQMLNQFLGATYPGTGSQNPLYTPGSPRSGELALKLIF